MQKTGLSLKWLEVFQLAATLGSVQAVAQESGLSMSTVSNHLSSLENHLGVSLLDHRRRPMVLTPAGEGFLKYVNGALSLIRKGQAEILSGKVHEARMLRLAMIEDFDSEIGPELAVYLASAMPNCNFTHLTQPSHKILEQLRKRHIDMGIANRPIHEIMDLQEKPLLCDPFILAVPMDTSNTPEELLSGESKLPFLRYSKTQIINSQIESQLRRLRISLPNKFQIDSNQTMMAMIAAGGGWAMTTPLSYMRAKRFHSQVKLQPFPSKAFARYISLFATPECSKTPQNLVHNILQSQIKKQVLDPALEMMPWLNGIFRMNHGD